MPVTTKNKGLKKASAVIDSNVGNYEKHPLCEKGK